MDQIDYKIMLLIADGQYHSGQALADYLSTSRAALHKRVTKINHFLEQMTKNDYFISSAKNRGYKLNKPFDGLKLDSIQSNLIFPSEVEFYPVIDSTNNHFISKSLDSNKFYVCLAELQTAGRGRNTPSKMKHWQAPFGYNISCSLAWQYSGNQNALLGLSLVAGITIAEVIADLGCQNVWLKWPNDILINNQKVAGILTEIIGDPNGVCKLIMGFGINVWGHFNERVLDDLNQKIDSPWTSIACNLHNAVIPAVEQGASKIDPGSAHVALDRDDKSLGTQIKRDQLISSLLNQFVQNYQDFIRQGLSIFLQRWTNYDILQNKIINIDIGGKIKSGTALGIDNQGALLVDIGGVEQVFHSGEVSVRIK